MLILSPRSFRRLAEIGRASPEMFVNWRGALFYRGLFNIPQRMAHPNPAGRFPFLSLWQFKLRGIAFIQKRVKWLVAPWLGCRFAGPWFGLIRFARGRGGVGRTVR